MMTSHLGRRESTSHSYTPISGENSSSYGTFPPEDQTSNGDGDSMAEDHSSLRRVPDSLPPPVWLVTILEMCERVAFFGIQGPLQNYIQNPADDPIRPGGLGMSVPIEESAL